MNICGVLIHAQPQQSQLVTQRLQRLPGVEVHGESDDGRLIVTIEDHVGNDSPAADTFLQFQQLEGVLSAALVYQYNDDYDHSQ